MRFKNTLSVTCKFLGCILALLYSQQIFSVGLGELQVYSYLNDPLEAEITLIGMQETDPTQINVGLASNKDFLRAGVPRPDILSSLKFAINKSSNSVKVKVYTEKFMQEPFLDFLVELVWPEGTIVKSYTILLDPRPISSTDTQQPRLNNSIITAESDPNTVKYSTANNIEERKSLPVFNNNSINLNPPDSANTESLTGAFSNKSTKSSVGNINNINVDTLKESKDNSNLPSALFAVSTEDFYDNQLDESEQNKLPNQEVLGKIIKSIQVFAENNSHSKSHYEKLLHLQPKVIALSKEEQLLAEKRAIAQINSELNILRNSNPFTVNDARINRLDDHSQGSESMKVVNDVTAKNYHLYNTGIVNPNNKVNDIYKDPNQLLWALFLITTTMFIFYKMLPAKNLEPDLAENIGNNRETINNFPRNSSQAISDFRVEQINHPEMKQHNLIQEIEGINSIENSESSFVSSKGSKDVEPQITNTDPDPVGQFFTRNEELELKMALANQYIEAGDSNSARELLEEIIKVKEQRYHSQIISMLKSIS